MEISQSYNAHPRGELVVGGTFSEILKILSSNVEGGL